MAIGMILLSLLLMCPSVWAETRTLTAEGEYVMGEGETMEVAGEKARKNAIRSAAEEAGAFVRSFTKVQNLVLREDVIEVVANHAMKVDVLDEQTELVGKKSVRFRTRIRATISSAEVEANIKKTQEDRTVVDAYRKLQEDYARLSRETEELKKKLPDASAGDRKEILAKIGTEEVRFKANVLYEKGVRLVTEAYDLNGADEALSQSITLNPGFAQAYAMRAQVRAHRDREKIDLALADIERAIALEPKNAEFYMKRAQIHRGFFNTKCGRNARTTCDRVFADMDRAIALEPENAWFHYHKGDLLAELERFDEAIAEVDTALRVDSGSGIFTSGYGVVATYMKRAQVQQKKGNIAAALADLDKAVRLADTPQFFMAEDRRIMETLKKLKQGEGMGGTLDDRMRARILEAFDIPPAKVDQEFPALYKKIEDSMARHALVIEAYKMRSDLRLEMEQYAAAKADMRMACQWDALNPDPENRIALCTSKSMEKDLARNYSPAGRWLKRGERIEQEFSFGGDARRGKPETIRQALDAFGKAIALDPQYAEAWEARCNLLPRSEEEY
jgi:tetratricopeptide (TPR) repeat protein